MPDQISQDILLGRNNEVNSLLVDDTRENIQKLLNPEFPSTAAKVPTLAPSIGEGVYNPVQSVLDKKDITPEQQTLLDASNYSRRNRQAMEGAAETSPDADAGAGRRYEVTDTIANKYLSGEIGYDPYGDNEDRYAKLDSENNPIYNTLVLNPARFVGRTVPSIVFKTGDMLASTVSTIGKGLLYAAPMAFLEPDTTVNIGDNAISRWFQDMDESLKEKILPVYQLASNRDQGFWHRVLNDPTFYTQDLADGVAFLGAAFLTTYLTGKVGLTGEGALAARTGERVARVASKVSRSLGKGAAADANAAALARNYVANGPKLGRMFDNATTTMLNSLGEASMEARDSADHVYEELMAQGYDNREAERLAGESYKSVFGTNLAILGISNSLFETAILKRAVARTSRNVVRGVDDRAGRLVYDVERDAIRERRLLENITGGANATTRTGKALDKVVNSRLGYYTAKGARGFVTEGLWEENMQLAAQRYYQDIDNLKNENTGILAGMVNSNILTKGISQMGSALSGNDNEASVSIGLGALIGVIGGTASGTATKEFSTLKKNTAENIATLTESLNTTFGDLFVRENGKVVFENGKPKVDEEKFAAWVTSNSLKTSILEDVDNAVSPMERDLKLKTFFGASVKEFSNAGMSAESIMEFKFNNFEKMGEKYIQELGFKDISEFKSFKSDIVEIARNHDNLSERLDNDVRFSPKKEDQVIENKRKNYLLNSGIIQTIYDQALRDTDQKIDKNQSELNKKVTSPLYSLIDQLNNLKSRIRYNDNFIKQFDNPNNTDPISIQETEKINNDLKKELEDVLENNKESLSGLAYSKSDDRYFDPKEERSFLNDRKIELMNERSQLENLRQTETRKFYSIASKDGLSEFRKINEANAKKRDVKEEDTRVELDENSNNGFDSQEPEASSAKGTASYTYTNEAGEQKEQVLTVGESYVTNKAETFLKTTLNGQNVQTFNHEFFKVLSINGKNILITWKDRFGIYNNYSVPLNMFEELGKVTAFSQLSDLQKIYFKNRDVSFDIHLARFQSPKGKISYRLHKIDPTQKGKYIGSQNDIVVKARLSHNTLTNPDGTKSPAIQITFKDLEGNLQSFDYNHEYLRNYAVNKTLLTNLTKTDEALLKEHSDKLQLQYETHRTYVAELLDNAIASLEENKNRSILNAKQLVALEAKIASLQKDAEFYSEFVEYALEEARKNNELDKRAVEVKWKKLFESGENARIFRESSKKLAETQDLLDQAEEMLESLEIVSTNLQMESHAIKKALDFYQRYNNQLETLGIEFGTFNDNLESEEGYLQQLQGEDVAQPYEELDELLNETNSEIEQVIEEIKVVKSLITTLKNWLASLNIIDTIRDLFTGNIRPSGMRKKIQDRIAEVMADSREDDDQDKLNDIKNLRGLLAKINDNTLTKTYLGELYNHIQDLRKSEAKLDELNSKLKELDSQRARIQYAIQNKIDILQQQEYVQGLYDLKAEMLNLHKQRIGDTAVKPVDPTLDFTDVVINDDNATNEISRTVFSNESVSKTMGQQVRDGKINDARDIKDFYYFFDQVFPFLENNTGFSFIPYNKDHNPHNLQLADSEKYDHTGLYLVQNINGKNVPIGVNGQPLTTQEQQNPENFIISSMHDSKSMPSANAKEEEILEWIHARYAKQSKFDKNKFLNTYKKYLKQVEVVKQSLKDGKPVSLPLQGALPGIALKDTAKPIAGPILPAKATSEDYRDMVVHIATLGNDTAIPGTNQIVPVGSVSVKRSSRDRKAYRVFNRNLTVEEMDTVAKSILRLTQLLSIRGENLTQEDLEERARLINYLQGTVRWSPPVEGTSPHAQQIWFSGGLHIGNRMLIGNMINVPKIKEYLTITDADGKYYNFYHAVNRTLVNKNEDINIPTFNSDGTVSKWNTIPYKEYLFSPEVNENPPLKTSAIIPDAQEKQTQSINAQVLFRMPAVDFVEEKPKKVEEAPKPVTSLPQPSVATVANPPAATAPTATFTEKEKVDVGGIEMISVKAGDQFIQTDANDLFTESLKDFQPRGKAVTVPATNVFTLGTNSVFKKFKTFKDGTPIRISFADKGITYRVVFVKKGNSLVPSGYRVQYREDLEPSNVLMDLISQTQNLTYSVRKFEKSPIADAMTVENFDGDFADQFKYLLMANSFIQVQEYVFAPKQIAAPVASPVAPQTIDQQAPTEDGQTNNPSPAAVADVVIPIQATEGGYETMAAEYLISSGVGVVLSTDYLLQGFAGAFSKANSLINTIRNNYAQELADKNLTDIKNLLGTETYNKIVSEVRDSISKAYDTKEALDIFDEILKYPTGLPNKLGNEISIKLDALNNKVTSSEGVMPVAEATKSKTFGVKRTKKFGTSDEQMRKLNSNSTNKNIQLEDLNEFNSWLSQTLPQISLKVENEVIDNIAQGQFVNGVIRLYRNAEIGTGFHEAFEAVWNSMLTTEEKQSLLDEFRSRQGTFKFAFDAEQTLAYSDASDYEAKETMAEEFREFMLNKQQGKTNLVKGAPKRNNFFIRLWNFIKDLFSNKSKIDEVESRISKIFDKIDMGEYSKVSPTFDFVKHNRPLTYNAEEGINFDTFTSSLMVDATHALFFRAVKDLEKTNPGFSISSLHDENFDLNTSQLFEDVYDELKARITDKDLDEWLTKDNFRKYLKPLYKDYLNSFNISFKDTERNKEEEPDDNEVVDKSNLVEAMEIDSRNLVNGTARLLVASLQNFNFDSESGTYRVQMVETEALSYPALVDYGSVMATLLNDLANTVSFYRDGQLLSRLDAMFDKLDLKYKRNGIYKQGYGWIQVLKSRLNYENLDGVKIDASTLSEDQIRLRVAFENSFANSFMRPLTLVTQEGNLYFTDSVFDSNRDRLRNEWMNNVKANPSQTLFTLNENGEYVLTGKDFERKTVEDRLDFLRKVGITPSLTEEDFAINPEYSDLLKDVTDRIALVINQDKVITLKSFYGKQEINKSLNDLYQLEYSVGNVANIKMFRNAEGKAQYSIVLPSTYSQIISALNSVKTVEDFKQTYPQYVDSKGDFKNFLRNSAIFPRTIGNKIVPGILFDANGNRNKKQISMYTVTGVNSDKDNSGVSTKGMTLIDKNIQELNHILNGRYYVLVNSDKSTEFAIDYGVLVNQKSNLDEVITNYYLPHLKDEINEILLHKNTNIQNLVDLLNDNQLGHFKDVIPFFDKDVQSLIDKTKGVDVYVNSVKVRNAIKDYIQKRSLELYDDYVTKGIIVEETDGVSLKYVSSDTLANFGITSNKMSKAVALNLVSIVYMNDNIVSREQHKLVYGDPRLYKDFTKRANAANSNRNVVNDNVANVEWLNQNRPRLDGKVRDNTTNTMSYADNNIVSNNMDKFAEDMYKELTQRKSNPVSKARAEEELGATFNDEGKIVKINFDAKGKLSKKSALSAYADMTENDAQAYILGDGYYDLLFMSGKLSHQQADLIEWHRAYERSVRSTWDNKYKWNYRTQEEKLADQETLAKGKPTNHGKPVILPTLKPQAFSYVNNPDILHTTFLKNSVTPLFFEHIQNRPLALAQYLNAQEQKVDIIGAASGQKVGYVFTEVTNTDGKISKKETAVFDEKGLINSATPPVQVMDNRFFGIQVEMAPKQKDAILTGSQIAKIVLTNAYNNGLAISDVIDTLTKEYLAVKQALVKKGEESLLRKLGLRIIDGEYVTDNVQELNKNLMKEAMRLDMPDNVLDIFRVDEEGNQVYKFDASPTRDRIEYLLMSMIDRSVVKQKTKGKLSVQVASTIHTLQENRDYLYLKDGLYVPYVKGQELTDQERASLKMTSTDLKFYEDEKGMEVYLPYYFKKNLDLGDVDFNTLDPRLKRIIGFRIPTQSMGQVETITIKGFLSEDLGDIIVVPSELVAKAGSDFDIDKLSLYMPHFIEQNGQYKYLEFLTDVNSTVLDRYRLYVRSNIQDYGTIASSLEQSEEYHNRTESILAYVESKKNAKNELTDVQAELNNLFNESSSLFSELPVSIKQQYRETGEILKSQKASIIEQQMYYINYADAWIDSFGDSNGIELSYRDNDGIEKVEQVRKSDVESILRMMQDVSRQIVTQQGLTEQQRAKLEEISKKSKIGIAEAKLNYDVQFYKVLAEFYDITSLEDFSNLPIEIQNSKEALQNKHLELMWGLVTNEENRRQLLTANGAEALKALSLEKSRLTGKPFVVDSVSRSDLANLRTKSIIRDIFLNAKALVALGAIQITSHTISQLGDVRLTGTYMLGLNQYTFDVNLETNKVDGKYSLAHVYTSSEDGKYISEIMSEFLSGFVDAAKDPFVFNLNINSETANLWFMLLKLGTPLETIAWFMNQPIISDYVAETYNNKSLVKSYFGDTVSAWKLQQKILNQYGAEINFSKYSDFKSWLSENVETQNFDFLKQDVLKDNIANVKNDNQIKYLIEFLKYQNHTKPFSSFINSLAVDTKHTKTLSENYSLLLKSEKVSKMEFIEDYDKVWNNTFLGSMYSARNRYNSFLEDKLVIAGKKASKFLSNATEYVSERSFTTEEARNKFLNRYQSFILSRLIQTTPQQLDGRTYKYADFMDMMRSSNPKSLAKELRKNDILRDALKENSLLKSLIFKLGDGKDTKLDSIVINLNNMTSYQINQASTEFKELMEELEIEISNEDNNARKDEMQHALNLLNRLVIFTVLQSGLQTSPVNFTKLFHLDTFAPKIMNILDNFEGKHSKTFSEYLTWKQFFQNNYTNPDIVKHIKLDSGMNPYLNEYVMNLQGGSFIAKDTFLVKPDDNDFYEDFLTIPNANIDPYSGELSNIRKELYELVTETPDGGVYQKVNVLGNGMYLTETYLQDTSTLEASEIFTVKTELSKYVVEPKQTVVAERFNFGGSKSNKSLKLTETESISQGNSVSLQEMKRVNIQMQPDNITKILAGIKTTTTRSSNQALQIGLAIGQTGIISLNNQEFLVTNRGFLTIEEAGGRNAIESSEAFENNIPKYQQTKDWLSGKGKLYVYDIKPYTTDSETSVKLDTSNISKSEIDNILSQKEQESKKCNN